MFLLTRWLLRADGKLTSLVGLRLGVRNWRVRLNRERSRSAEGRRFRTAGVPAGSYDARLSHIPKSTAGHPRQFENVTSPRMYFTYESARDSLFGFPLARQMPAGTPALLVLKSLWEIPRDEIWRGCVSWVELR